MTRLENELLAALQRIVTDANTEDEQEGDWIAIEIPRDAIVEARAVIAKAFTL